MSQPSAAEMYDYLSKNYYTMKQLVEFSQLEETKILKLIQHQCIPPHSYEVKNEAIFSNQIMEYTVNRSTLRYYHPSLIQWIHNANELVQKYNLHEAALIIRDDFYKKLMVAFGDEYIDDHHYYTKTWEYLMNGTWGICLKEISVNAIAKKELARKKIASIVRADPLHQLTEQERNDLKNAISSYNSVASDFDPYFVAKSSRRLEIEATITKYQL